MKYLILTLITLSLAFQAIAQLEYYSDQQFRTTQYEILLEQMQKKIPQHQHNLRTANPQWFEEYMIAFQEELLFPGTSTCFLRDGEVYWKSHHGLANINNAIPITDETAYTVASISKTIMITAVMQLYEQELFELEDDISDHIPFLVRNYNHPEEVITIKQLMTHTSSIQDNYIVLNNALFLGGDNPTPMDTFLEGYLIEDGTYFQADNYYAYAPGSTYNYSNVGSCILAYMVEQKSGLDFETYCQQNVFGPLGMGGTSYLFDNLDTEDLALPYTIVAPNITLTPQSSWPIYPIGNLKVSSLQLAKHLGMYMNKGTFNDSLLLQPSTVDLITDHHYINENINAYMGLIWFIDPYPWFYSHTGRWYGFNTIYGFNKDEDYGMIWLSNGDNYGQINETIEFWFNLIIYSAQYEPFSIETLTITDEDNDGILEAGETVEIYPGIRNNTNLTSMVEDLALTLSTDNPIINTLIDSTSAMGSIGYLETENNLSDPITIQLSNSITPGSIDLNIGYSWGEEGDYLGTLELFIGQADILLVSDEEDERSMIIPSANWYAQALDSLGYTYQLYDLGQRGDPSSSLVNSFPVVIWFTGYDSINTLTTENQVVLSSYLDNGGRLFLSGQNICNELAGSNFLENYLHVEYVADSWSGNYFIFGVEDDPIGNEMAFIVGSGDGAPNQYSLDIIEPLEEGETVFTYFTGPESAAVRYENDTFKTVFLGFGFEGINNYQNRYEVMYRILNDYFGIIVGQEESPANNSSDEGFKVFPNPGSSEFTFSYYLPVDSPVNITLYDINGSSIKTVIERNQKIGANELTLNANDLFPGIYFCVLISDYGIQTTKLIKL